MGIQKDAGELLIYLYNKHCEGTGWGIWETKESLMEETEWEENRVIRALDYLEEKGMVELSKAIGGFVAASKVLSYGIDIIETKPEFKKQFNFTVGIPGVFSFSRGASEK